MDKNTVVVMTLGNLSDFLQERQDKAQIKLIKDQIAPFDARRARTMIKRIECNTQKNTPRRKNQSSPRELVVRVLKGTDHTDFSDIQQYLVREQ
jgi:hypothetical protein